MTSAIFVLRHSDSVLCAEFHQLARTCGFAPCIELRVPGNIHPQNYLGSGKMKTLAAYMEMYKPHAILFDSQLTPTQIRNVERATQIKILDRNDVILGIFARRAHTFEAKLQVHRAQLERQYTHLTRAWTHLERQRGGIGVRGGPGEAQLESDKRKLRRECKQVDKRLERVRRSRGLSRVNRRRARTPLVVLVGRTNAGKSTLFNALSNADALVANRMFATIETTSRHVRCFGVDFVLADTVGFIRHLPHELIESFHATLEEVREADLLLQLTDISSECWRSDEQEVHGVLAKIDALDVPRVHVYTKLDCWQDNSGVCAYRNRTGLVERLYLSATTGEGLNLLRIAIAEHLRGAMQRRTVLLNAKQGALQATLHQRGVVLSENTRPCGGWRMDILLPQQEWQYLRSNLL